MSSFSTQKSLSLVHWLNCPGEWKGEEKYKLVINTLQNVHLGIECHF